MVKIKYRKGDLVVWRIDDDPAREIICTILVDTNRHLPARIEDANGTKFQVSLHRLRKYKDE